MASRSIKLTPTEREVTLIAVGILLGFGYLTGWKGYKQTLRFPKDRRYRSPYVWSVWVAYVATYSHGTFGWLLLQGHVRPRTSIWIAMVIFWSIQAQALLNIIVNRISLITVSRNKIRMLHIMCHAILWFCTFLTGFSWVPSQFQDAHPRAPHLPHVFLKVSKLLSLSIDACMNLYFIWIVQKQFIEPGLDKYKPLVSHNFRIVCIALVMDVMSVVLMFDQTSPFVWLQFTPLTFITKLNIELSMSDLIMRLATQKDTIRCQRELAELSAVPKPVNDSTSAQSTAAEVDLMEVDLMELEPVEVDLMDSTDPGLDSWQWEVLRTREVVVDVESTVAGGSGSASAPVSDRDEQPLREEREWERVGYGSVSYGTEVKTREEQ